MVHLGTLYEKGHGVPKNYEQALSLYRKAAAMQTSGSDLAMTRLGLMYENGHGVPKDYKQAASWFLKGQHSEWARINLGILYQNGWGVRRNICEARKLYRGGWMDAGTDRDLAIAAWTLWKKTPDCPTTGSQTQISTPEAVIGVGVIFFLAGLALSPDQPENSSNRSLPNPLLEDVKRDRENQRNLRNACIAGQISMSNGNPGMCF